MQACRTNKEKGEPCEEFLATSSAAEEFLAGSNANLLALIISQQRSGGRLLQFIIASCSKQLLQQLITAKDLQSVTQECLPFRTEDTIADFRARANMLCEIDPKLLETAMKEAQEVVSWLSEEVSLKTKIREIALSGLENNPTPPAELSVLLYKTPIVISELNLEALQGSVAELKSVLTDRKELSAKNNSQQPLSTKKCLPWLYHPKKLSLEDTTFQQH